MRPRQRGLHVILAALLACVCSASAQPAPAFVHERDMYVSTWEATPQWNGRLLLNLLDNKSSSPLIQTFDREGRREGIPFDLPGSSGIYLYTYGAGADGSVAVGGGALSADSRGVLFVTWVSPDRQRRVVIRTDPFTARAVTVAADGVIWAVGRTFDFENMVDISRNVLQRYDTSGKVLSSVVIKNAKSWTNMPGDAAEASFLLASNDRVGWLTNGLQYIEFALDGTEVGRYDGPDGMVWLECGGRALSGDNQLILGRRVGAKFDILALDRKGRAWKPVTLPDQSAEPGSHVHVLGFDGPTLVTSGALGTLRRWVQSSSPQ
jgi:hypothetical protein